MEILALERPCVWVMPCTTATLRAGWSCTYPMVSCTDTRSVKMKFGVWLCYDVFSVAHLWVKNCKELLPSSSRPSRFDQPIQASQWLKNFKITNERFLSKVQLDVFIVLQGLREFIYASGSFLCVHHLITLFCPHKLIFIILIYSFII